MYVGVELGTVATTDIREESTMERMLCVELLSISGGLQRSVTVSLAPPNLEGFATAGLLTILLKFIT